MDNKKKAIKVKPKDLKEFPSYTIWFGNLVDVDYNKIIVNMKTKDGEQVKAVDIPLGKGPFDYRLPHYKGEEIAFSLEEGSDFNVKSGKRKPSGKYHLYLVLQKIPLDIPEV